MSAMGMRRAVRLVVPAVILLLWLVGAALGGPKFGQIDEVSSNDPTAYLPASADATEVQRSLAQFRGDDVVPAVLVFTSEGELGGAESEAVAETLTRVAAIAGVGEGSPPIPSDDGRALQAFLPVDADAELGDVVAEIREVLGAELPDGVDGVVTGPAGFSADLVAAFAGIDGLLLAVALGAVLVILVIVYRSLLLPIAVLATSVFALCVALLTVWWLAKAGVFLLSGQTQGILFILVIGAATDYSLLYVARYREALETVADPGRATVLAWRGSVEPILASGGTVIAGLLCLLLSQLESNRALGPVAAVGIAFAMLSALTLLPALLFLLRRGAFWPRVPRAPRRPAGQHAAETPDTSLEARGGMWAGLARGVSRRPRAIWVVTTLALAVCALGLGQLRADGVPASEFVLGTSEAREGQRALAEHFPGGSGSPAYVLADEEAQAEVVDILLASPGVSGVAIVSEESPSGTATVTSDGVRAVGPPGAPAPRPTTVEGRVLFEATLIDAADALAAEETVRALRTQLDGTAVVGGVTATAVDTQAASIADRTLILPLVLAVILVILCVLLRAFLAPLLLIVTVVLSFAAALGISALLFEHIFRFPGADPAVPLFGFVFLVALGVDYNIFLMTRVREEALAHGARSGVRRGLVATGGVITSAGLVLAATFAALAVLPILFLLQLAVIVVIGVLLDTFIVRTLLVPALALDLGRVIWWPSGLARSDRTDVRERKRARA